MKKYLVLLSIFICGLCSAMDNKISWKDGQPLTLESTKGIEIKLSPDAESDAVFKIFPNSTNAISKIQIGNESFSETMTKTFPVIHFDLFNSYQSLCTEYLDSIKFYDFEVKASTNNFQTLVYYFLSTQDQKTEIQPDVNFIDRGAVVLFKDANYKHTSQWGIMGEGYVDGRVWLKKNPSSSIYECVQDPTTAYITSICLIISKEQYTWKPDGRIVPADTSWMYEENPNLQWIISRLSPTDLERNNFNNHLFNNIIPEWTKIKKQIDWAIPMTNSNYTINE